MFVIKITGEFEINRKLKREIAISYYIAGQGFSLHHEYFKNAVKEVTKIQLFLETTIVDLSLKGLLGRKTKAHYFLVIEVDYLQNQCVFARQIKPRRK